MIDLVTEIIAALKNDETVALATIIGSSGSTPLPPGSMLLVRNGGRTVLGTVGGGAVEGGVITESIHVLEGTEESVIREFELSEVGTELGMICGGRVDVLIERIAPAHLARFSQFADARDEQGTCIFLRGIVKKSGVVHRMMLVDATANPVLASALTEFCEECGVSVNALLPALQRADRHEVVERVAGLHGEIIIQPIVGTQPLIIFGGGHIGRLLSKCAALAGFSVTVVDDRADYAQPDRFPDADCTIADRWSASFGRLKFTPATSIVIVTSGHKSDAEVLRQSVTNEVRYIGMIGSRKKVGATFSQLLNDGVPVDLLQRVHAPIGLDIGAVTAEEIAISIVAELIRVRRGFEKVSAPLSAQMAAWFDRPQS
jgi:xanthine dehydrogenase accessory factor